MLHSPAHLRKTELCGSSSQGIVGMEVGRIVQKDWHSGEWSATQWRWHVFQNKE